MPRPYYWLMESPLIMEAPRKLKSILNNDIEELQELVAVESVRAKS